MKKSKQLERLYRDQKLAQLEKPARLGWKVILLCLILTLVFGFLAGLGGGLLVLVTRTFKIPFYKEFNLDEMLPKREITIKTREVISVAPDEQVEELIKQTQNQVVKIFKKKKEGGKILEQIYRDEESLGQGFVLTNDGWIVSVQQKMLMDYQQAASPGTAVPGLVIATSNKKIYPVEKILLDPLTDVVFLKIEAKDLEIIKLAEAEEIFLGQRVLISNGRGVAIRILGDWDIKKLENEEQLKNLIESTEEFSRFFRLDQGLENTFIGSPVISLKGSIIGIMNYESGIRKKEKEKKDTIDTIDTMIPVIHFKSIIDQILKQGKSLESGSYLTRPAIGIDYLDLAQIQGITDKRFKDLRKGALIWGPPAKDSPGEKAGLKNADVILKVNNNLVNGRHNLTELIQEYKPGDKIELTILREGREEKVEVELEKYSHK